MLASLEHAALFEQKMNQGCLSVSNEVWVCVPNYVSRYVLWCNIIYAWLTVNLFMVHSNNNNQYFFLDCYLQFYIYATYIYGTKVHWLTCYVIQWRFRWEKLFCYCVMLCNVLFCFVSLGVTLNLFIFSFLRKCGIHSWRVVFIIAFVALYSSIFTTLQMFVYFHTEKNVAFINTPHYYSGVYFCCNKWCHFLHHCFYFIIKCLIRHR